MKFVILFAFLSLLQSCSKDSKVSDISCFRMEVDNSILVKTVQAYISENHVSAKNQVITITSAGCKSRTSIYIETIIHNPYILIEKPIGYSIIGGVLVLFYNNSAISHYSKTETEILNIIKSRNIKLEQTVDRTYDPPIWEVIKCGDKMYSFKNPMNNVSPCPACDF